MPSVCLLHFYATVLSYKARALQNLHGSSWSRLSTQRFTGRWNYNSRFPFTAVNEIRPLVHVALPWQARFRHMLNLCNRNLVIPDIDICQHPLECLAIVKATPQIVLLLTKHQRSSWLYHVTGLQSCALYNHSTVFVKFPWPRLVLPGDANVVPFAIVSWYRCRAAVKAYWV